MSVESDTRQMAVGLGFLQAFEAMSWDEKLRLMDAVRKCQCAGCGLLRKAVGSQLMTEFMPKRNT